MILRALVFRPIARETLRSALTILGIAVGVAVVVAIQLANQSALRAFRESVDAVAGRANYQIVSEALPLPEEILIRLQPLWRSGVRFAPVIDVEGLVEPSQTPIRLLGVDLLSDLHFREYRFTRIVTSAQGGAADSATVYLELFRPDSVILPSTFAREQGLTIGSPILMNIHGQRRTMIVRGILEATGPATAFHGSIAVADIAAVQQNFDFPGRLTRVDLIIPSDRILKEIERILPQGARIERPSRRGERVDRMLRAFRVNLFALAGVALLVGVFLVYNTVLISILRRRREVGILKTLGVSAGQIFRAFLLEGLLFGVLGAVTGILLGKVLATGLLTLIGRTINALYISSQPDVVTLTPGIITLGLVIGIALSALAALQPSIEAARLQPNVMIRPALQQRVPNRRLVSFALAAAISFAAAAGAALIPPRGGIAVGGYLSVLLVVIAFSLLAPLFIRAASAMAAPAMRRIFGLVGLLAAAALPASLRRTAVASAALTLATGMMIAVALMVGSFRETVRIWVAQTVSSDLWLRPAKGLSNAQVALFPAEIGDELRRVPFVEAFDRVRGRDIVYRDSYVTIASGDFDVAMRFSDLPMVRPRSARDALRQATASGGVLVSETFANRHDRDIGASVELPTKSGPRQFPITGIYRDYSNDRGAVVMDRRLWIESFDDDAINTIVVYLKAGTNKDVARRELEKRFGPRYNAFAVANAEIRQEVMRIFDQTFLITYALLGIAIVVAVLGIVNTLAALILERTRELALLRVGGMSPAELRTMIVLESAVLGLTSLVTGLGMGYVLSWILINVINKQSFGWTIQFHPPVALIGASLATTLIASILAGLIPANMARKVDLAAAIKAE